MRHIVHITGLWHHRLKTVKLFLEPICVRFRVAKSPFFGAQFNPNLLQRVFAQPFPDRFWVTDITYIPTAKGMVYMCTVLDLCGKMVLAYRIGGDMTSSLVTDTVREACKKEKVADGRILHSDQDFNIQTKHTLT